MNYQQAIRHILYNKQQRTIDARTIYLHCLDNDTFYQADIALRKYTREGNQDKINSANELRNKALALLSIHPSQLAYQPICTLCHDEGFINKVYCNCVKQIVYNAFLEKHPYLKECSFNNIDQEFYQDKSASKKLISHLTTYCNKFEDSKKQQILLLGNTGTGKTYLASCIANFIIKSGYSVMFVSAMQFVRSMLDYHTTFDNSNQDFLAPYLDCDLLIIDDLGTETIFKNITLEYLYLTINYRLSNKKHTTVTSNLSQAQIQDRYGVRITSRLFDKQASFVNVFEGQDKRIHSIAVN